MRDEATEHGLVVKHGLVLIMFNRLVDPAQPRTWQQQFEHHGAATCHGMDGWGAGFSWHAQHGIARMRQPP